MTKKGTKQAVSARTSAPADAALGLRIRQARNEAKLSQEELGNALGVTFQQIQKYEKGTNRLTAPRLVQLSKTLGKPISFFIEEAKYKPNSRGEKIAEFLATRNGSQLLDVMVDLKPDLQAQVISVAKALARHLEAA
jgi:transcriptional regulator with XRE-family HTH domain